MINITKQIIRGILLIFCLCVFGAGALILEYILWPSVRLFSKSDRDKKVTYSKILQGSWIFFIGLMKFLRLIRIDSQDIEKLKSIKNSIIVCTHPSYIDILILISIIPQTTCFVAERLKNNIFFKNILKSLFIVEGQPVEQWTSEAADILNDGFNLVVFPMGIRHRKNEFPKIRRGTALLAQKTHNDIAVVNMETNYDFMQIHQPVYDVGSETVVYSIKYRGIINVKEFLDIYPDDVTFKTELSKYIAKTLYHDKKE